MNNCHVAYLIDKSQGRAMTIAINVRNKIMKIHKRACHMPEMISNDSTEKFGTPHPNLTLCPHKMWV